MNFLFFNLFSNHCERPGRILAIWKGLKSCGLNERCIMIPSRSATKEEILLVHSDQFYERIKCTKTATKEDLDELLGSLRSIEYSNVIRIDNCIVFLVQ